MKHSWIMYVFLLILIGVMARNAAGTVAVMLGGSQAGTGIIGALEGPQNSAGGSVSFNNGTKVSL